MSLPAQQLTAPRPHHIYTLLYTGFFLTGIVTTFLGPLLPTLAARWQINDIQSGYLFTALSVGGMAGALASGFLVKRYGFAPLLTSSYLLMAGAVIVLPVCGWPVCLAAIFTSGLALGLVIPFSTLLVAELAPVRSAPAINILNLFWGLGAVVSPLLMARLTQNYGLRATLWTLGGALLLFCGALWAGLQEAVKPHTETATLPAPANGHMPRRVMLFGLATFIYVGTESAIGGWLTTYTNRLGLSGTTLGALANSLLWAGLLSGRALAPLFLAKISEEQLIMGGMSLALAGQALFLTGVSPLALAAGALLAGLGLGPIFPTLMALFTGRMRGAASWIKGFPFLLGNLGGASLPWAVGLVSAASGQLQTALFVPFLAGALLLPLTLLIRRQTRGDL